MSLWLLPPIVFVIAFLLSVVLLQRRLRRTPRLFVTHGITSGRSGSNTISPDSLNLLVETVAASGLSWGTIEEAITDPLCVALTFDDGYDDVMALVPLLETQKLQLTIFIPTGFIGRTNDWDNFVERGTKKHLSKQQIRLLADLGVGFGSHGVTHRDLTRLQDADLKAELEHSKLHLLQLTGTEPNAIAYPYGLCNDRVIKAARQAGYRFGLTATPRPFDGFTAGRMPLTQLDCPFVLRQKVHCGIVAGIESLKAAIVNSYARLTPLSQSFLDNVASKKTLPDV